MFTAENNHTLYDETRFQWRMMRDVVKGPHAVKMANEIYLPMPSGMREIPADVAGTVSGVGDYQRQFLPWWHPNPAYRAYMQRARFPDLTANALRGMHGMITKYAPKMDLPDRLAYLEDRATPAGKSLASLYSKCVSEILVAGKGAIVADVDAANEFRIAFYSAESNTHWKVENIDGYEILTEAEFIESCDDSTKTVFYRLVDNVATSQHFVDGEPESEPIVLKYRGKTFDRLPIEFFNAIENSAEPTTIPLMGIADIAVSIYQLDADLRHAEFLTCNPTLFIFGITPKEIPAIIGSSVTISVQNPAGSALYPATDTSAFEHIRHRMKDLFDEAISYGAQLFATGMNGRDSGEALSQKGSARGMSLVGVATNAADAIENLLDMIATISGVGGEVVFKANLEFAEKELTSSDIREIVAAWLNGAVDHDTVIDNMRDAGYVKGERTNDEIKNNIENEAPSFDIGTNE